MHCFWWKTLFALYSCHPHISVAINTENPNDKLMTVNFFFLSDQGHLRLPRLLTRVLLTNRAIVDSLHLMCTLWMRMFCRSVCLIFIFFICIYLYYTLPLAFLGHIEIFLGRNRVFRWYIFLLFPCINMGNNKRLDSLNTLPLFNSKLPVLKIAIHACLSGFADYIIYTIWVHLVEVQHDPEVDTDWMT